MMFRDHQYIQPNSDWKVFFRSFWFRRPT